MTRCALACSFLVALGLRGEGLGTLKNVTVPEVPDLDRYVRDKNALLVLGKALFWDMRVGSDGRTACATCHFHAGADHRSRNQFSNPLGTFDANRQALTNDFPIASAVRVGSAGVVHRTLTGLSGDRSETGVNAPDAKGFRIGDLYTRQVTPRNTPTIINAVFNVRNFLDGRASDVFNGRTPFGESDPALNAVAVSNGHLQPEIVRLTHSSLASQAVAPPLNTTEMAYEGRTWAVIARKLIAARPLALQHVAPDDSVLGTYAHGSGPGLDSEYTYRALIQAAFQPAYWDSAESVNGQSAAEFNFPLFFGIAIQAYETTLIANDSRFDQYADGNRAALTLQEVDGFLALQTHAFCQFCHAGPELTKASYSAAAEKGLIDAVLTGSPGSLTFLSTDTGFFHTGVRPGAEDEGLNGADTFGRPFSIAARSGSTPLGIDGSFKIPGLRNVEFTGPYFHNGGYATLEQVIDFYVRGGDFPDAADRPVQIVPFPFTDTDRAQLLAFLKSLSDDRVRFERAPFDHPELCVPIGYPDAPQPDPQFPGSALDQWAGIPAVGRAGNSVPLQTFEELLLGVGNDGSRAHTLTDACPIQ